VGQGNPTPSRDKEGYLFSSPERNQDGVEDRVKESGGSGDGEGKTCLHPVP